MQDFKRFDFKRFDRVRYVPHHATSEADCEVGTVHRVRDNCDLVFIKFDSQVAKVGFNDAVAPGCDPKQLQLLGNKGDSATQAQASADNSDPYSEESQSGGFEDNDIPF